MAVSTHAAWATASCGIASQSTRKPCERLRTGVLMLTSVVGPERTSDKLNTDQHTQYGLHYMSSSAVCTTRACKCPVYSGGMMHHGKGACQTVLWHRCVLQDAHMRASAVSWLTLPSQSLTSKHPSLLVDCVALNAAAGTMSCVIGHSCSAALTTRQYKLA